MIFEKVGKIIFIFIIHFIVYKLKKKKGLKFLPMSTTTESMEKNYVHARTNGKSQLNYYHKINQIFTLAEIIYRLTESIQFPHTLSEFSKILLVKLKT